MRDRQDILDKLEGLGMIQTTDYDELVEEDKHRVEIAEEFYLSGWEEAAESLQEQGEQFREEFK